VIKVEGEIIGRGDRICTCAVLQASEPVGEILTLSEVEGEGPRSRKS
jgi:hypothetical protein